MDSWIIFWKILYIIGIISFYGMVLLIAPMGLIDIFKLFRKLAKNPTEELKLP